MSEPSESIWWGCCDADVEDCDFILCSLCHKGYHLDCIATTEVGKNIASGQDVSPNWACPSCSAKSKSRNSTPLRSQNRPPKRAALNSPPKTDSSLTRDDVRDVVQELFYREMENLFIRLSQQISASMVSELAPIKKEMSELRASITFINEQFEGVLMKQTSVTEEMKEIHAENAENAFSEHGYARGNNIEVQCVPERNNENVINIVQNISDIIGCDIKDENILSCSRIAKLNPKGARPRSIVVQFNSPRVRDTFLASSIKFNKSNTSNRLNSSHIGLNGEKTPIFVVEHLSASNKALHSAARLAAREKGYKFVWVRNGRIFMRKTETSDYKIIKNLEALNNLEDWESMCEDLWICIDFPDRNSIRKIAVCAVYLPSPIKRPILEHFIANCNR
ncbi:Zinc finger DNA binding protein, partial [Operophtera brumata]